MFSQFLRCTLSICTDMQNARASSQVKKNINSGEKIAAVADQECEEHRPLVIS